MPKPRKFQISREVTPYYHCVSRCVRRAFLCGQDRYTGQSYDHRRSLLEADILRLSEVFFIDAVAYSVMSNHYHVIWFLNHKQYTEASDRDVVGRWHQVHKGTEISARFLQGDSLELHEREQLSAHVALWRDRLFSISWIMRVLNERVARMANLEDEVTGRFWEGRFKCDALLDEKALLSCMAYVDLNPVRAGMADAPENSRYTSIGKRIEEIKKAQIKGANSELSQPASLHKFCGNSQQCSDTGIACSLMDYLQLVDWTGRQIREGKAGHISDRQSPILERLSMSPKHWVYLSTHFESKLKGLIGSVHSLERAIGKFGRVRLQGKSQNLRVFG